MSEKVEQAKQEAKQEIRDEIEKVTAIDPGSAEESMHQLMLLGELREELQMIDELARECSFCDGTGEPATDSPIVVPSKTCPECDGKGVVLPY